MIKLALKIFLFLSALYCVIFIISKYDNAIVKSKNILSVKASVLNKNSDYLFVGPSYIYSGIDPLLFDSSRAFNLGVATAGPCFSELIIDDHIRASDSRPKIIFLSVSYSTFSDIASDAWEKYPIHRYLNRPIANEIIFCRYTSIKDYFKLLRNSFKEGCSSITLGRADPKLSTKLEELKALKGFSPSEGHYSYDQFIKEKKIFSSYLRSDYDYKKEKLFFDLLRKYKNMGIHLVVIEPPTFRLNEFFSEDFKERYLNFKSICVKENIELVEANVDMDSSCFMNLDHMNIKGATIYTNYLKTKCNLN